MSISNRKPSDKKDLVLALAQILAGTALLSGLYFTWRTLQVNREGQITERFTRAIDQLGKTDDKGKLAFAGSGLILRQRSDIAAGLLATDSGGPTVTGGGALVIDAKTGGTQVGIAGSIISGGAGSTGVGLSVLVNDVVSKVAAFVGAAPSGADTTPTGAVTLDVGDTSITAHTGGVWVNVVATGTVISSQPGAPVPLSEDPDDPLDFEDPESEPDDPLEPPP